MTTLLESDTQITWSEEGRQIWKDMGEHVGKLMAAYGPQHRWVTDATASFTSAAMHLTGWKQLRVMKDGPLSLYCVGDSIHFGVIFHKVQRRCTTEGCKAYVNDDGHVWLYDATGFRCPDGTAHVLSYPLDAPAPGTWSFHS